MKIILDGMGGDNAPEEIVKGAVEASEEIRHDICIVGKEERIKEDLSKYKYNPEQVTVVNANEVITNEDSPVRTVRKKPDSSLVVGLSMLKGGRGDLFVSAGNTGAIVVASRMILGKLEGIDRPCIASIYPILGGIPSLLIDAGANPDCRPQNLLQQAMMGSVYMEKVIGRENPTVGLVNLGAEEGKGTLMTKEVYPLLEGSNINFIGNIEARDVPKGACDVIVSDGFTGNVILKLTEGLAWNILKLLKKKFTDGGKARMGALLLKDKMMELKEEFDYSEYGGAPILGVKGPVVKMHGSSSANAVKNTIIKAVPFAEQDVISLIKHEMYDLEEILDSEKY